MAPLKGLPMILMQSHLCCSFDNIYARVRPESGHECPSEYILGLFFKISGTSSRVVTMLSNAGVCVSSRTIERLKVRITDDAIRLAVELITSGQVFFHIFDNINIFLRKSQQRISNTNDMINATNCAIVGINGVEPFTEADQLALSGQRTKAKSTDILPTPEDDIIVGKSFVALIAEMIVAFTPGNSRWKDRKDIAEAVAAMMPEDRPLSPDKSDARPYGLLDGAGDKDKDSAPPADPNERKQSASSVEFLAASGYRHLSLPDVRARAAVPRLVAPCEGTSPPALKMDDDADGDAGGDVDADGDSGCLEHGNDNDGDLFLPGRRRCSDAEGGAWGVWRGRKSAWRAADPVPALHAAASPRGEVIRGEDGAAESTEAA
ncbi:hypothetical protein B0H14DRAFT_3454815 [Mycena olivaceomarginata]|nr:hypothetical protein B0H14DRAFT_3454815 [Mycena olivaceomarginata]